MTVISTFKAAGVVEESFKGRTAHSLDSARKKLLDQFIKDAMNRAKVLGSAIAIIQGGKFIYQKGFGLRELGKKETVTPNTLFMIGSTTKSLTSLMMAKLVDEGKFGWETPVSQVLPSFVVVRRRSSSFVVVRRRAFFVIVPIEYREAGAPPPNWFIDERMK